MHVPFRCCLLSLLAGLWPTPPAAAQDARTAAVQVTATVTVEPPAIHCAWVPDPTASGYQVVRRLAGTTGWGPLVTIPGGGSATSWTDANVAVGVRYEYWFTKNGPPHGQSFLAAGIEVPPVHDRGTVVLVVDDSQAAALGPRLDRLVDDLVGDGWTVRRHDVAPTQTPASVRSLIRAEAIVAAAEPDQGPVRAVFLLGHVPVPYSGDIMPDGHADHRGAWPADTYYGQRQGSWSDSFVHSTGAVRPANWNVPGDGKFDPSVVPVPIEFGVGRVDFADLPAFALGETALLQQYLDKNHAFRHGHFTVARRAVLEDNFGFLYGDYPAASGWRNLPTLVGPDQVTVADYFTTLDAADGDGWLWAYACGPGSYTSSAGVGTTVDFATRTNRNVFSLLFGSYFGDWNTTDNFLRAALGCGWTLATAWAGRPHWSFHGMGLGEPLAAAAVVSQNEQGIAVNSYRSVHVALLGDPTLRQHVVPPPHAVTVVDTWPSAQVHWQPAADAVAGYHVYRAEAPAGPFARLTPLAVDATSFVDPAPLEGPSTYMVRALRLETTPSGSYWNLSQGAFASTFLPEQQASHQSHGAGCYTISDSFYQWFPTAAAASAACSGRSIVLTPNDDGYRVDLGGAIFVPPSAGATPLALADDGMAEVPLAVPFPHPGGSASSLFVHENGIVGAAEGTPPAAALPDVAALLAAPVAAWYSWHDFTTEEPGSGSIVVETIDGTLCVTWDGVESAPADVANPGTLQFQFELATGVVRLCWPALSPVGDADAGNEPLSGPHLIGWSPAGPSADTGPIDLGVDLPIRFGATNVAALALTASPAPVSTPLDGTLLTYTIDHTPEAAPGTGVHLGATFLGLTAITNGYPLAFAGMPGCFQHVDDLVDVVAAVGFGPSLVTTFWLPPGFPPGFEFHATAAALMQPFSLPNGANAFGAVTSNRITSFVAPQ
ncbi:MAG: hypothetical protein KF830_13095 [Planctomycetes bacterium]|nr:hypothetical protein [Planctomycetota bacterium]